MATTLRSAAAAFAPAGVTSLPVAAPHDESRVQLSEAPGAKAGGVDGGKTLEVSLRRQRRRVLTVHGLALVENSLRILQPLMIAWAVNDLLVRSYLGLAALILVHLAFTLVGSVRQMFCSRVFGGLTADVTANLLEDEQLRDDKPGLARRLNSSREQLGFLDESVPLVIHVAFTVIGALVILGWYDLALVPVCLVLLIPAVLLNAAYGRTAALVSGRLHAEFRREPHVLAVGESREIRRHLDALCRWRGQLSDAEASHFCLMELFVGGVMATALAHFCLTTAPLAGDILAVVGYVLLFVTGLRQVPQVVHSFAQHRTNRAWS
ncbi:MAG: ABC transporter six-transmembrane domain-containing protein [Planctomycetaceae bacterium]